MPLPSGEAIEQFVERWLEKKGIELRCPACHRSDWQPSQYTIAPHISADRQELLHDFYVFLPLFCRHCAYVVMFNALMMEKMSS
jgi:hypothetical protein